LQFRRLNLHFPVNTMRIKFARVFLPLLTAAALMAGCATSSDENAVTTRNGPVLGGPNGSISPANPFGLGLGRGLNPAH